MLRGIALTFKCEDICVNCGTYFLKNPDNLGDYEGGQLLRYCPICGKMLPLLRSETEPEIISQTAKRCIGTRIARTYRLDYTIMNDIVKDLKYITHERAFIKGLESRMKETFGLEVTLKAFL